MKAIITSLLTNDFYKFSMQQMILRKFPDVNVRYRLYNRGKTQFPKDFEKKLQEQVEALGKLSFTQEELNFLRKKAPFLKESYLEWLERFQPKVEQVHIKQQNGDLEVEIEGPWYQSIYWEIPLMAIISELYFMETHQVPDNEYLQRAEQKFHLLKTNGVTFADFGLRRRFSREVHENVLLKMMAYAKDQNTPGGFVGTSSVDLAYKYNLQPIGTMAHELPMVLACIFGYQSANEILLDSWQEEFNGDLGIALTDTFTTNVFLRSFTRKYAKAFDGVRHDSGSPEAFTNKIVEHYKSIGIDPLTKTITFSDGLNAKRAVEISEYCKNKIKCSFGIGTNFTNDVGVEPLNIVIKACMAGRNQWPMIPAIKLSDMEGKVTGDIKMVELAKYFLGIS